MALKKKFPYRAALVACNGGCRAKKDPGCEYGCIGCGTCVEGCKFEAIWINEIGVAQVDEEKCVACGKCVKACPRQIIHLHECANYIVVKCSNKDKGKAAKEVCDVSCIGCGICENTCTTDAIHLVDNCPVIDESNCLSCGMCANKCPRNVILDQRGILTKSK
jgi:ferredoxin